MKSECGRFEFLPEIGIYDSLSKRNVCLDGQIMQIKGMREIMFSAETKSILNKFISQIKLVEKEMTKSAKQERLN